MPRRFLLHTAVLCGLALVPGVASANPTGGSVAGGSASISSSGTTVTINQSSSRAVLDWSSFNIGSAERVSFSQPSSSSIALNRIHDSQPSSIDGQLSANGQVWLMNPNGIAFGNGAQVNVGGLIATSSDIADSDFMSGNYRFTTPGNPAASVSNAGTITVADTGLVALVAPQVANSGVINARLGKVEFASGDTFALDLYGDGLIGLGVSGSVARQLVANSGAIQADGGQVQLTAAAASNAVGGVINMSGVIEARTLGDLTGNVDIYAQGSNAVPDNDAALKGQKSGSSTVLVSGTIDASGYGAGQKGGTVQVLGDQVGLLSGSRIDVSGDAGGGTVQVGGDFHGQGATPTATAAVMQSGATIKADAIGSGNGGNVTLWADSYTNFAGSISARGGAQGGNGGYVETSGRQMLDMSGLVDASALWGKAGTWLMDPEDITISTGADSDIGGSPSFVPSGTQATATLNVSDITTALNNDTNVSVTTGGDAQAGPHGGSITVANALSATTGTGGHVGNLTLSSYNDITINAPITLGGAGVTGGNLILDADNHANGSGYIDIASALTSNGGNITMGGGSGAITAGSGYAVGNAGQSYGVFINNVAVNAGGGNILINGKGFNTTTNNNIGLYVAGGSAALETSGNGSITINGIGQGNSNSGSNYGVYVAGGTITGNGGALSITGVGGNSTGSDNFGVYLNGGTISNTGGGDITMNATGGGSGNSSADYGLYMQGTLSTVNGNITVNGRGGDSGGSGNINEGINLSNAGNIIKSTGNGSIFLTGTGGGDNGTGSQNYGLYVYQATVSASGTGGITLVGTGSNSSGGINEGVNIGSAAVAAGGGNISIIGTGGNSSGSNNTGIQVGGGTGSTIETTGSGTITLTGTGQGNTNSGGDNGISLSSLVTVSAADGNITLSGAGGGAGSGNGSNSMGVFIGYPGSTIETTRSGNILITGTGGNIGTDQNQGIYVQVAGGVQALGTGNITLVGSGGGNGSSNVNGGVDVNGSVTAAGGNITLTGTGGNTTGTQNYGVDINYGTVSTSGTGTITFNGTGGGTGAAGSDSGVIVYDGAQVKAVNGSINIAGAGSPGNGGSNYGLYVKDVGSTVETTGTGNISVNASGSKDNYGVDIASADGLEAAGTGAVTVVAAGSNFFLDTSGSILSNAPGTAITLASGEDFLNKAGASALSTPDGRWLIYSTTPSTDRFDGVKEDFILFGCAYGGSCPPIPGRSNGFLFSENIPAPVAIADAALASIAVPLEWQKLAKQDSSPKPLPATYCKSVAGSPVCYPM